MGLINNDNYVASNGVEKVGTYISFATETLYLRQAGNQSGVKTYMVNANYRIYWDQECREMGKSFIDLKSVSATVTEEQLNSNMYEVLYDALKVIYPNTGNTRLAAPAPAAPSEPVASAEPVVPDAPSEPVASAEPVVPAAPVEPVAPSENVIVSL
jgi:hypothetical protein